MKWPFFAVLLVAILSWVWKLAKYRELTCDDGGFIVILCVSLTPLNRYTVFAAPEGISLLSIRLTGHWYNAVWNHVIKSTEGHHNKIKPTSVPRQWHEYGRWFDDVEWNRIAFLSIMVSVDGEMLRNHLFLNLVIELELDDNLWVIIVNLKKLTKEFF